MKQQFAFVIAQNAKNKGADIRKKTPLVYLLGRFRRHHFSGLVKTETEWTDDKRAAKRYSTERRAISAGQRITSGWFVVRKVLLTAQDANSAK